MAKEVYEQVTDGDWVHPKHRGYKQQCCDCGLIHTYNFRVIDGKVSFQIRVDRRATAAVRRKKKGAK